MQLPKQECIHISQVLEQAQEALKSKNSLQLKELSDKTIHDACSYQDEASITIAVVLYGLGKIIERGDFSRMNWEMFVKKFNSNLALAISSIREEKTELYQNYIQQGRRILESQAVSIKPYIQDVLKKAAINKGSKIYSHGISLEQTARILGTSQWELSEYIGQKEKDEKQGQTLNVKQRARMAMEFFS